MPLTKPLEGDVGDNSVDVERVKRGNETRQVWTYDNSTIAEQKAKIEELKSYIVEHIDYQDAEGENVFSFERLNKDYKLTKMKNEALFEEDRVKNGETVLKYKLRKMPCDFDPYEETRKIIDTHRDGPKAANATDPEDDAVKHLRHQDWSLYQNAEHTHDLPFSYLDEISVIH